MDKKTNSKARNTSTLIIQGAAIVVLVFGLLVGAFGALIKGFLDGSPPNSDHDSTLPVHKNENVKVETDAYGKAESVSDTVYITNNQEQTILVDKSILSNVSNRKQSANVPDKPEEGKLVWHAKGYDVSYKGTAEPSDLPITISVEYYLDGKPTDSEDLIGKTGELKIVVKYHNNINATLEDGTKITVPYAATSLLISTADYSKVECSTGKTINISGNEVAVGVNLPGMKELSGSSLFGVGTSETIFTGKIVNFQGAQIKTLITGDIVRNLDPTKLAQINIDSLVVKVASVASGIVNKTDQYLPYVDTVAGYVPIVRDTSSKARSTTNIVTEKLIKFIEDLDTNFNTVDGVYNVYQDFIDRMYNDIYGEEQDDKSGTSVNDTINGLSDVLIGDDADNPEIVKNLEDLAKYVKNEMDATAEGSEEHAALESRLNDIYINIAELDPTSEVLPDDIKKEYEGETGLIEEYKDTQDLLAKYEKIYNDPAFVENYFKTRRAELEEEIAKETDQTKLAKLNKELDNLNKFEKKCIKEDGTYMTLNDLQNSKTSAVEIISYIIDQNITPEEKASLIAKLEKANGFVNKTDDLIQKYGAQIPGLVKQIKKIKNKIDEIYYNQFLKYLGIYNSELKGTAQALAKSIEGHQRVNNFSGLPEGWTGSTNYTFTVPVGKDKSLLQLIDIEGILDGRKDITNF